MDRKQIIEVLKDVISYVLTTEPNEDGLDGYVLEPFANRIDSLYTPDISEEEMDIESMCMSILKKYGLEGESLIGGTQTLALMEESAESALSKIKPREVSVEEISEIIFRMMGSHGVIKWRCVDAANAIHQLIYETNKTEK